LFVKYIFFTLIYCLLTKSNITNLLFITTLTSVVVLLLKFFINRNFDINRYLSIVSIILIIPLGFPENIKESILPFGYQYISISLISSLFFLANDLNKNAKISNFDLITNTINASLAPTSYFSGPSATYEEIKPNSNEINPKNKNLLKNIKPILAISGAFRLSVGFILSSFNFDFILNNFNLLWLTKFDNFVFLTLLGFYNFWKYYLLFSGASELCKAVLTLFSINVIDNFKEPESSSFYHEIWNRWHLNITERIRNFLFTPITLYALRRFSKFNQTLKFILIEAMPIFALFTILAIWHGARKTDFLFGIISSLFCLVSKFLSTKKNFIYLININKIFKEFFRFLNLSIFGGILIIYDFKDHTTSNSQLEISYKEFLPYLIISFLAFLYYRYKNFTLNSSDSLNKKFSIIYFEIVIIIATNLLIIPELRSLSNFIYFNN